MEVNPIILYQIEHWLNWSYIFYQQKYIFTEPARANGFRYYIKFDYIQGPGKQHRYIDKRDVSFAIFSKKVFSGFDSHVVYS